MRIQQTIKGVMVVVGLMAAGAALADPVGGSIQHFDRVRAHDVDQYTITLRGGEETWIDVDGDGDTDLDLYVYDASGRQICAADGPSDSMRCRIWTPYTQTFTVRVRNRGNVYNEYMLTAV
jgi:hypothetical protein